MVPTPRPSSFAVTQTPGAPQVKLNSREGVVFWERAGSLVNYEFCSFAVTQTPGAQQVKLNGRATVVFYETECSVNYETELGRD
jgi:hypothetical protein